MPQALDLATLSPRQGVSKSSSARRPEPREPADDFGKVLKRQTRRPEPQQRAEKAEAPKPRDEVAETEATEEAKPTDESKPAAKTRKKEKPAADETQASEDTESTEGEAVEKPANDTPAAMPVIAIAGEDLEEHATEGREDADAEPTGALALEIAANPDAAVAQLAMQAPAAIQAQVQDVATAAVDGGEGEALREVQQALTPTQTAAKPVDPNALGNAAPIDTGEDAQMGAPIKLPTDATGEQTDADLSNLAKAPSAPTADDGAIPIEGTEVGKEFSQVLQTAQQPVTQTPVTAPTAAAPVAAAPERNFADDNVDRVVTSIKSELLPTGGTMKIRLDPEHLGQMQIDVTMDDGVLTASFETNNSEATRLLSHSLQQLKTALETTGVSVERIQVKQAAPAEPSSSNQQGEGERQQQNPEDHPSRQEQQRREMLQRMWAKLGVGSDPLDLVA